MFDQHHTPESSSSDEPITVPIGRAGAWQGSRPPIRVARLKVWDTLLAGGMGSMMAIFLGCFVAEFLGIGREFAFFRGNIRLPIMIASVPVGAISWLLLSLAVQATANSDNVGASLLRLLHWFAGLLLFLAFMGFLVTVIYVKLLPLPEKQRPDVERLQPSSLNRSKN